MPDKIDYRVSVDPVRCQGHGICTLLLPERIELDRWGYPIVDETPLSTRSERRHARRAGRACPRAALLVEPAPPPVSTT